VAEADVAQAGLKVGQYLKSVRESRGLKLEEASHVTKVGKNYLIAIEEGQFDKLPNPAYIKGFLRLYAGFLSLSGDEVVRRYDQECAAERPIADTKGRPEVPGADITERARLKNRGKWAIPLLLLVLVALAALFFNEGEDRRERPAAKPAPAPAVAPVTAPVQPPRSSAGLPTVTAPAANPALVPPVTAPPVNGALPPAVVQPGPAGQAPAAGTPRRDGIILRLHFNQDSWLSITIDDSISQRYDLKAGDIIEWKGKRSFVLDIGDGVAAAAEYNGRPLKALGEAGKPAHVELKGE
jgi:cytoskeleton protein RodZ